MTINGSSLPPWYITEKETGSTIQTLADAKELAFYLQNPDPFIRRLAILRLGQLKLKETGSLLLGILDDQLETEDNRKISALLLKKNGESLHLGFFMSQHLSQFLTEEEIDDLLTIPVTDSLPDIPLNFQNSLIESQLNFDNEFLKCSLDEKYELQPLEMKKWIGRALSVAWVGVRNKVRLLTGALVSLLFIKGPRRLISLAASVPARLKSKRQERLQSKEVKPDKAPRSRPVTYSHPRAKTYHPPLGIRLKGLIRTFTNILLAPFRLVYRLRWVMLGTLVILYSLFSFTSPGKSLLFRLNPQAYYMNHDFLGQADIFIKNLIRSNDTLASILGTNIAAAPAEPSESPKNVQNLVVTASKGLYLRAEPNASGEKLALMKPNLVVEFLGEEKKDASGNIWYSVRLNEDTTGWANARYLKEDSQ